MELTPRPAAPACLRTRALPLVFAAAALVWISGAGPMPAHAAPPTYYVYHGERVELPLDASRLAIRFRAELSPAAGMDAVAAAGVAALAAEPTGVARWQLIALSRPLAGAEDAARRIAALTQSPLVEFAAPVFQFDDDQWATLTPYILLRFRPEFAADAELLLPVLAPELAVRTPEFAGPAGTFELESSARDGFAVLAIANRLAESREIAWAEPDMQATTRTDFIPNDPLFPDLWGIRNTGQFGGQINFDMDGDEAWDLTTGDSSIKIMIMDSGVQQNHPDLNQDPGRDFTGEGGGGGPMNQCDNHGTTVAGCVSAIINNALGVVGIAPDCRVVSARMSVSDVPCTGGGVYQSSWVTSALYWAEAQGFRVTNMSLELSVPSSAIDDAYAATHAAGIVHFASAGNDGLPIIGYPASLEVVNAVAALAPGGFRAGFSNYGVGLDVSAPGQSIVTTDRTGSAGYGPGDYFTVDGTSFSAPYAAGVAALILAVNPYYTAAQTDARLYATCRDLGAPGYDTNYGWGFVNALSAANVLYALTMNLTSPPLQIGGASEVVSFAAEIRNRGFAADTYTITMSGVPGSWSYSYTTPAGTFSGPSTLTLAAGATAPITVDIDSQGNPGTATMTLRAVSQGDPTQESSVSFTKLNNTQVLVVDDDGGENRQVVVENTLAAVGRAFGTWDRQWGPLTLDNLTDAAGAVIWLTGTTSLSLDADERTLLASYMDGGGKLFLTGQEIAYDLADPLSPYYSPDTILWFILNLQCGYQQTVSGIPYVSGVTGDLIGDGLAFSLEPAGPNAQPTPDVLAQTSSTPVFFYEGIPTWLCGVRFTNGSKYLVYLSFGFEGIIEANQRELLLGRILDWFGISAGVDVIEAPATPFSLLESVPNPATATSTIRYRLSAAGPVSLRIYDVGGRLVRTLVDGRQPAAEHRLQWNGRDDAGRLVPSGVYFYRLEAGGRSAAERLVLIR